MPDVMTKPDSRNGSNIVASTLLHEMRRDPATILFGEDVGVMGGVFGASRQLARELGSQRVFDTPISEAAIVGMAVGAAQAGLRPIAEIMFVDFIGVCFDQIINQLAKNHYMSGGRERLPVVLRTAAGCIGSAAQHSQVLTGTLAHIPGLKVVFPGSPGDLQGLLLTAIRDDNPVIFIEHKMLLKSKLASLPFNDAAPLEEPPQPIPFGKLRTVVDGHDLTIVTAGWMVQQSVQVARALAEEGIAVRVVDLRTLVPLDRDGLTAVARESECLLVVDEDYLSYGMAAEVVATISERLGKLAPRMRRHALEVPVPASRVLEDAVLPGFDSILAQARRLVAAR